MLVLAPGVSEASRPVADTEPSVAAHWQTYHNPDLKISLRYPRALSSQSLPPEPAAGGYAVQTWSFPDSGNKQFIELVYHALPGGMSPEVWLADYLNSDCKKQFVPGTGSRICRHRRLFEAVLEESAFIPMPEEGRILELTLVVQGVFGWAERPVEEVEHEHRAALHVFNEMLGSVKLGPIAEARADTSLYEIFRHEMLRRDLTGDAIPELISVLSVRGLAESMSPHTFVDVFQQIGGGFQRIHRIGMEVFDSVRFVDISADGVPELVIKGIYGTHGHFLNIVSFSSHGRRKVASHLDLWKETNPLGVLLRTDVKTGAVIYSGVEPAGENWSYADPHPWRCYRWNGRRFIFSKVVPYATVGK